jgi:hypothetical protein
MGSCLTYFFRKRDNNNELFNQSHYLYNRQQKCPLSQSLCNSFIQNDYNQSHQNEYHINNKIISENNIKK